MIAGEWESSFIGFARSALDQSHREGAKLVKTSLIDSLWDWLTVSLLVDVTTWERTERPIVR